jgi:hypothetical protein
MYDLWQAAGWFPGDKVWRAEFQLRRFCLAQFGLHTVSQVLGAIGSLWGYLTADWLRLVSADGGDSNRARWATHPLWERL